MLPAESRALGGGREGQGFRAPRTLARLAWGGDAVRSECALGDGGPAGGRAQSECRRFKESGDKDGGGGFLGGGAAEESGRVRIGWKAMGTWGRQAGTLDTHSPESVFTGAAPIDSRRLRWCRGSFRHQQAGTPRRRDARTPAFAHESPVSAHCALRGAGGPGTRGSGAHSQGVRVWSLSSLSPQGPRKPGAHSRCIMSACGINEWLICVL